ncbi:hypothetical protein SH2C18_14890 [Clostridium sediminicola]|uniref:hypothetical protein n=1 Tax=Clostridium sediminicola TaxID=3114879 RepID=UPI0031F1DD93
MYEKILAFHDLSRKYFIDIQENFKNELTKLWKIIEESHNETDNNINKEIEIYEDFNKKHPYWIIRKDIVRVILNSIESIFPEDFHSLDEIKKSIMLACETANISERIYYSDISNELRIEICNKEKQKFFNYIENSDEICLKNLELIFSRRVISKEKINGVKHKIDLKRDNLTLKNINIICFDKEDFLEEIKTNNLLEIFSRNKIEKIYEINNGGIDSASYYMDILAMDISRVGLFFADGFNKYWCSDEMDWMIEENHEGYYFVYGEWLIKEIKKIWPTWEERVVEFS